MEPINTIDYRGFKIEIHQDYNPQNPREDDNLGTMVCFHRRYTLGDKHDPLSEAFSGWDDMKAYFVKQGAVVVLPLYLYDHSGLRMKVGSFQGLLPQGHAEFDSGQVGFIYVTKETLYRECDCRKITKKIADKALKILEGEVETYNQYLSGDSYGYVVKNPNGEDHDSCWGFFGKKYCIEEAKGVVDYHLDEKPVRDEIHRLEEV